MRRVAFILLFAVATSSAQAGEIKNALHTFRSLLVAPVHWKKAQWLRFGEGAGAVIAVAAGDHVIDNGVQHVRGTATDDISKYATPWGSQRSVYLAWALAGSGVLLHDQNLVDTGRDTIEAQMWSGLVVTPALKYALGRARPFLNEGFHSFHPLRSLNGHYQSFPSGHATAAFATATAIASHYDNKVVPIIVYTVATAVAYSRVNDHVHWPSDVVAGALIGHVVAKGVVIRHRHVQISPLIAPHTIGVVFYSSSR